MVVVVAEEQAHVYHNMESQALAGLGRTGLALQKDREESMQSHRKPSPFHPQVPNRPFHHFQEVPDLPGRHHCVEV